MPKPKSKIAVVITTYNGSKKLKKALLSILNQSVLPAELIIVNDSPDIALATDSMDVLLRMPESLSWKIIQNPKCLGPSASRNIGVNHSSCCYIAFLDDDDVFFPNKIEQITSLIYSYKPDLLFNSMRIQYVNENLFRTVRRSEGFLTNSLKKLLLTNIIGGASMVTVKRESFIKLGGFDESLSFLEDHELWLRFAESNYIIYGTSAILTQYECETKRRSLSKDIEGNRQARKDITQKFSCYYDKLSHEERNLFFISCIREEYYRSILQYDYLESLRYGLKIFLHSRTVLNLTMLLITFLGSKNIIRARCLFSKIFRN